MNNRFKETEKNVCFNALPLTIHISPPREGYTIVTPKDAAYAILDSTKTKEVQTVTIMRNGKPLVFNDGKHSVQGAIIIPLEGDSETLDIYFAGERSIISSGDRGNQVAIKGTNFVRKVTNELPHHYMLYVFTKLPRTIDWTF